MKAIRKSSLRGRREDLVLSNVVVALQHSAEQWSQVTMVFQKAFALVLLCLLFPTGSDSWWRRRRRRAPPPPSPPRPSARDCTLSTWTSWSSCNHQCGTSGTRSRTRHRLVHEAHGGSCRGPFWESEVCNRGLCQNGGTPWSGYCSCRPGYQGTCCGKGVLGPQ